MKTVEFRGTVSEGTMRPQDVLPACMDVLKDYHPEAHQLVTDTISEKFNVTYTDLCGDDAHQGWWSVNQWWLMDGFVWPAMNEVAPDGYYFGAHPGDGADYGFWLCEDWEDAAEVVVHDGETCYCCGRGDTVLQPCPQCGEALCQDCTPPFGGHMCEPD